MFAGLIVRLHAAIHRALVTSVRSKLEHAAVADRLSQVLAAQDPLTGLLNPAGLRQWVDEQVAGRTDATRLGVAVANVERLAAINELFGIAEGDRVLATFGARLQALDHGVAAARLAGDEFALVAVLAHDIEVVGLQDRLLHAVLEPFVVHSQPLDVSLRTAYAVGGPHDVERLLARATARVREQRVVRTPSLTRTTGPLEERRQLLEELRAGLVRGEIQPWFQPLVGCADANIRGWEALVRWVHPARGILPPSRFLGLVALGGLTTTVTDVMLSGSVRFARALVDQGRAGAARIHVNLTAPEARRPDLPDLMARSVAEAGLPPGSLATEITEQDVLHVDAALLENLHRFELLGIGAAIDDFGTGYSSLSHLLDLRAQELKIDKRFVDGLPADRASATLVRAIIGVAGGLGLRTVAEGVQDVHQARFLAANGCDQLQGHLVAPAMHFDAALAFAARWTPAAGRVQMYQNDPLTAV
ncbi:MAG: bifunctional diguanylate cyclase/phosphodiesterase [Acidimicrobiales bacterium]